MKPSKVPPRTIGCYIFRGTRHIRAAMYEHIAEPVQLVEVPSKARKELAVVMLGRAAKFQLEKFSGTWELINVEETP